MDKNLQILLDIVTILVAISYQYNIYRYASSILKNSHKNKVVYLAFTAINSSLFVLLYILSVPYFTWFIFMFFFFIVEFKFLANTDIVQIVNGACIFTMHIGGIFIPFSIILSVVNDVSVESIYTNRDEYFYILFNISCLVMLTMQTIVGKHIDSKSIQRVTVKNKFSTMLMLGTSSIVIYKSVHFMLISLSEQRYNEQIILTVATSLAALLVFYFIFLYSIRLVNANLYKRYSDKVLKEQDEISKLKDDLSRKIARDDLTGVYNRKYVLSVLDEICKIQDRKFSVMFSDVNALKYVNDNYGHDAGDRLITKVANAITKSIREEDIVARIGGDEFLIIVNEITKNDCDDVVNRIYAAVAKENETEVFTISTSIGYVIVDEELKQKGSSSIISLADEKMRENKKKYYEKLKGGTL